MVVLLICISYFDYVIRCGPYPQVQVQLRKKKSGKESHDMFSHPETGLDPPIRSDRELGCDKHAIFRMVVTNYKKKMRGEVLEVHHNIRFTFKR